MINKPLPNTYFYVPKRLKDTITILDAVEENGEISYLLDFSACFEVQTHIIVPVSKLGLYDLADLNTISAPNFRIKLRTESETGSPNFVELSRPITYQVEERTKYAQFFRTIYGESIINENGYFIGDRDAEADLLYNIINLKIVSNTKKKGNIFSMDFSDAYFECGRYILKNPQALFWSSKQYLQFLEDFDSLKKILEIKDFSKFLRTTKAVLLDVKTKNIINIDVPVLPLKVFVDKNNLGVVERVAIVSSDPSALSFQDLYTFYFNESVTTIQQTTAQTKELNEKKYTSLHLSDLNLPDTLKNISEIKTLTIKNAQNLTVGNILKLTFLDELKLTDELKAKNLGNSVRELRNNNKHLQIYDYDTLNNKLDEIPLGESKWGLEKNKTLFEYIETYSKNSFEDIGNKIIRKNEEIKRMITLNVKALIDHGIETKDVELIKGVMYSEIDWKSWGFDGGNDSTLFKLLVYFMQFPDTDESVVKIKNKFGFYKRLCEVYVKVTGIPDYCYMWVLLKQTYLASENYSSKYKNPLYYYPGTMTTEAKNFLSTLKTPNSFSFAKIRDNLAATFRNLQIPIWLVSLFTREQIWNNTHEKMYLTVDNKVFLNPDKADLIGDNIEMVYTIEEIIFFRTLGICTEEGQVKPNERTNFKDEIIN